MELKETAAADCASSFVSPPPAPPAPPAVADLCSSSVESHLLLRDVTFEEEMMETTMGRTSKKTTCSVDCKRKTSSMQNNTVGQQEQTNKSTKVNSESLTNPDKSSTAIVAHQSSSSSSTVVCVCSSSSSSSTTSNNHQQQQQQQVNISSLHHTHHHPQHPHHRNDCGLDSREDSLLLGNDPLLPIFSADDNREFDFLLKAPLLPRSSSLKSRKSPPLADTPYTHRKSVRFADALGLDLELIRHILNPDEPPNVPLTAMRFLESVDHHQHPSKVISYWRVCFPHPSTSRNLLDRVLHEKVSLETCSIVNSTRKVYGTVRVANIAYEKNVCIRYSLNGWLTCEEVPATYIEHSNDLITDRFSFELLIPDHLVARSRLEFAIKFTAANKIFWDNNFMRNYALQCVDYNNDL